MLIDLNADLGEGSPLEAALIPLLTSANVCCGQHAGNSLEMLATLQHAAVHRLSIGAHPGYADRTHFGRRELDLSPTEVRELVQYQVAALIGVAGRVGLSVDYVKPHGALYNQAVWDETTAKAIVEACNWLELPLVGLPQSAMQRTALEMNCRFFAEGFADRRYRSDGTLVPRQEPDALLTDVSQATEQVLRLVQTKQVDTICVHGDTPEAVEFAKAVRETLQASGVRLEPMMRVTG